MEAISMSVDYKKLLFDLYNAPNADSVYQIVCSYGLDSPEFWKPYGGISNNAGTFENQQSSPENALVEKITNSIDAILMKECMIRGINPKDKNNPNLPQTINAATKMFFNVERQKDDLHSAISIYDTTDFSLSNQILLGEDMMLDHIEFDKETNKYYVLGFVRNADLIIEHGFVAEFEDNQIKNITVNHKSPSWS